MFFCGDDAQAKSTVSTLIASLDWEPLDVGILNKPFIWNTRHWCGYEWFAWGNKTPIWYGEYTEVSTMKTVLITGGTSGIGLELVKYFDKGIGYSSLPETKAKRIPIKEHQLTATPCMVDFSSLQSVADCQDSSADLPSLDILINNASLANGVLWNPWWVGNEFCGEPLGSDALTLELLPLLNKAPAAKLSTRPVGSPPRHLKFEDLEFRNGVQRDLHLLPIKTVQHPILPTPKDTPSRHFHHGQHRSLRVCTVLSIRKYESSSFKVFPLHLKNSECDLRRWSTWIEGVSGKYYFKKSEEPRLSKLAQDSVGKDLVEQKYVLPDWVCNQLTSPRSRFTLVKSSQYWHISVPHWPPCAWKPVKLSPL